jgi:hypothetical protein
MQACMRARACVSRGRKLVGGLLVVNMRECARVREFGRVGLCDEHARVCNDVIGGLRANNENDGSWRSRVNNGNDGCW